LLISNFVFFKKQNILDNFTTFLSNNYEESIKVCVPVLQTNSNNLESSQSYEAELSDLLEKGKGVEKSEDSTFFFFVSSFLLLTFSFFSRSKIEISGFPQFLKKYVPSRS